MCCRDRSAQAQQVAIYPKTGNLAFGDVSDHRVVAKGFTGVDVGHVHFNDGALEDR